MIISGQIEDATEWCFRIVKFKNITMALNKSYSILIQVYNLISLKYRIQILVDLYFNRSLRSVLPISYSQAVLQLHLCDITCTQATTKKDSLSIKIYHRFGGSRDPLGR